MENVIKWAYFTNDWSSVFIVTYFKAIAAKMHKTWT